MKININDEVAVALTEAGRAQWARYWNRYSNNEGKVPDAVVTAKTLSNGKVRFQIWEMMNIFGASCYNGSNDLPFETNEIEFLEN